MAISISIEKNKLYSVFDLNQDVSFDDFKSALKFLSKNLRCLGMMHSVWDFRGSNPSNIRRSKLDKIVDLIEKNLCGLDTIKIASVVDNDLQYCFSRILQFYLDEKIEKLKIFKNHNDALYWVAKLDMP